MKLLSDPEACQHVLVRLYPDGGPGALRVGRRPPLTKEEMPSLSCLAYSVGMHFTAQALSQHGHASQGVSGHHNERKTEKSEPNACSEMATARDRTERESVTLEDCTIMISCKCNVGGAPHAHAQPTRSGAICSGCGSSSSVFFCTKFQMCNKEAVIYIYIYIYIYIFFLTGLQVNSESNFKLRQRICEFV